MDWHYHVKKTRQLYKGSGKNQIEILDIAGKTYKKGGDIQDTLQKADKVVKAVSKVLNYDNANKVRRLMGNRDNLPLTSPEKHIPSANYTGPGTRLFERLRHNNRKLTLKENAVLRRFESGKLLSDGDINVLMNVGENGWNQLDVLSKRHDIMYANSETLPTEEEQMRYRRIADEIYLKKIKDLNLKGVGSLVASNIFKIKKKLEDNSLGFVVDAAVGKSRRSGKSIEKTVKWVKKGAAAKSLSSAIHSKKIKDN